MNKIEQELLQHIKEPIKADTRQAYLFQLAKQLDIMLDDDFEKLSTEAQGWLNDAIYRMNQRPRRPIDDFEGGEDA